ncbi:MAG: MarR family transcriptional regulator [Candidatus Schekmanbacteria bacterium]|nr:MAG: MarR family transcriptional regulator [Candidatus Schekmanbacteria bacterium]
MKNNNISVKAERFERAFWEFYNVSRQKTKYRFSDSNVTEAQFMAMLFLRRNPNCTMSDLKDWMGLHMSTLTGITDRLVRDGFVERFRDEKDRRLVKVRLTKKGMATVSKLWRIRRERIENFLSLLTEDDQISLIELFERISETVKSKLNHNNKNNIKR